MGDDAHAGDAAVDEGFEDVELIEHGEESGEGGGEEGKDGGGEGDEEVGCEGVGRGKNIGDLYYFVFVC